MIEHFDGGYPFQDEEFTPHGYLDNPSHSAVYNNSGVIRSVPPIGFGFWCRRLPMGYSSGLPIRNVNYLSFLLPALTIDGTVFKSTADFEANGVKLTSRYHTKNILSYNMNYQGICLSLQYFLASENGLICRIEVANDTNEEKEIQIHATHMYGYPEVKWWGCNGITACHHNDLDVSVSKIYAYGDVFVLGADRASTERIYTSSEKELEEWILGKRPSNEQSEVSMPGPLYAAQRYVLKIKAEQTGFMTLALARGLESRKVKKLHHELLKQSDTIWKKKQWEDNMFYKSVPRLTGDWPSSWKRGWVYDIETLRMTVREPVGIYRHHWDGMQIFNPRSVLGESAIDALGLSYVNPELAKEILLGVFADSPAPNVPCSREDGSMNMIGADGSECGTSPVWGLPFQVIRSIYERDRDAEWIRQLYPYLKSFLEWWLIHRTDKEGWFHCNNSWESGQDGSKRFLIDHPSSVEDVPVAGYKKVKEAQPAEYVRTVDVEAIMANAFDNMSAFAQIAGKEDDASKWKEMADKRIETTRAMFVDGEFRDFDARNGKPIILENYHDVMMLTPITVGIATTEQIEQMKDRIKYFLDNDKFWLEWSSFVQIYLDAAWNAGLRNLASEAVMRIGNRIYKRADGQKAIPRSELNDYTGNELNFPERFDYRIPGSGTERWDIDEGGSGLCEHYGWGAVLPAHIIRNIIGFRESQETSFLVAPAIPSDWLSLGSSIGISNLSLVDARINVEYSGSSTSEESLQLKIVVYMEKNDAYRNLYVIDQDGRIISKACIGGKQISVTFEGENFKIYRIEWI